MQTISVTDTAKIIRKALKKAFPDVVFSVRSRSYSGGASIDIHWTDGPTQKQVDAITDKFEGASFDGMQDLKTYNKSLVSNPDGTVSEVRYGSDYIHTCRRISDFERKESEILALIKARCVLDSDGRFAGDWIDNLARRMVYASHDKESMEAAFTRLISSGGHETL